MNEKNLIPQAHKFTPEEQSKGGISSGITRGFKSALKKHLKENPRDFDEIVNAVVEEAKAGNIRAVECLIDLNGESAQREMAKIRAKELKLKEQNLKKEGTGVMERLDSVLGGIKSGF